MDKSLDSRDGFRHYSNEIARLRPEGAPESVVLLLRTDSTNRLGRRIADEYQAEEQPLPPLLVLALEQTGGRGRQGRDWVSPAGKGVYASRIVLLDDSAPLQSLPLLVGVGLCRALAPFLPAPCRLKWPNDLVVETPEGRRKIGGILIEAAARAGGPSLAVLGFGVNYSHEAADLPETGASLRTLGVDGSLSLEALTWALVMGVERELAHMGDMAYAAAAWRELAVHQPGERITFHGGEGTGGTDGIIEGEYAGIDDHGRLILRTGDGEQRLSSGDVV